MIHHFHSQSSCTFATNMKGYMKGCALMTFRRDMEDIAEHIKDAEDQTMQKQINEQIDSYARTPGFNCYAEKFIREMISDFQYHITKKYNLRFN